MELRDLFISTMAGAGVVLTGAFYALFYALAKLNRHRLAMVAATFSYLGLVAATWLLVDALNLSGAWLAIPAAMLIGYLLAPLAIWRLSVDIHGEPEADARR